MVVAVGLPIWMRLCCVADMDVRRAYANIMAPLLPTHMYQLSIVPGNAANPGVRSDPFFGSQPLETLEAGSPDSVSFTTQRLRDRVEYPQNFQTLRLKVRGPHGRVQGTCGWLAAQSGCGWGAGCPGWV